MNISNIAQQIYTKILVIPTLNQNLIIEKIDNWLTNQHHETIFVLNGYAGTGKTTVIAAMVNALKDNNIGVTLLAPTGRAANVLSRYSHHAAYTIHKHIYRERTNAQYQSSYSLSYNNSKEMVYIVDEASMLSDDASIGGGFGSGSLLSDLVKFVRSGTRCRLMLVGDNAQLPPVGSDFSPALDPSTMGYYADVEYATMDEVVRQRGDSGILFNATLIREMMAQGIYQKPIFDLNFPDIESLEGCDLTETIQDCYDKYGRDETIIITRSNKRANRFNEGIRRYTTYAEERIESGDIVMVVKNNYHYTERLKSPPTSFIANGDVARIEKIYRFEELYGFDFADVRLSFADYNDFELRCKILLNTLASESPSLSRDESQRLFNEVEQDYTDINSRIERFKQIRENEHFNALQIKFAYSVTCHKAQGGQWRAVIIDRYLFGDEEMTLDLMRWLYTAITRATDKVYILT
ncbi:MAG: AAA family ATPase [Rikenellaceae bacterium]